MSIALLMVTAMVSTNAMQEIQAKTSHSSNFNENKIVNQNIPPCLAIIAERSRM